MKRYLVLEDGSVFEGKAFGSNNFKIGELVFNTGMSGYQEVLSDLSYCGQIVMMTYPMIGNYGINMDDFESVEPAVFGFVVDEYCKLPSNYKALMDIDEYLKMKDISGIYDIDTRMLTKKIRTLGTMKAMMCDDINQVEIVIEKLKNAEDMHNHVELVSTLKPFMVPNSGHKVVLMDFGAKEGIIKELNKRNCDIVVVPYNTDAKTILSFNPDGVMLSNGPGDPKDMVVAIQTIKELIGKVVIFGICLGHQLIGLACNADTIKLKFGHRGLNHPVLNLETNKVEITSQNHSYAIDEKSLENTDLVLTHKALNDQSVEGMRHKKYPVFSVQYHPEANPGPKDANYLFDKFINAMEINKEEK